MAKGKLSEQEQDEMKALEDMRKGAGQGGTQFSDSQRIRLSQLMNKEKGGGEAEVGATTTAASSTRTAAEEKDKDEVTSSRFSSGTIGNKGR